MHLWNKLIQTLLLTEDLASFRLAFQLIEDKDSILYWIWCSERKEELKLPEYNRSWPPFSRVYTAADDWMDRNQMENLYKKSGYDRLDTRGKPAFAYLQALKKKLNV